MSKKNHLRVFRVGDLIRMDPNLTYIDPDEPFFGLVLGLRIYEAELWYDCWWFGGSICTYHANKTHVWKKVQCL